MTAKPKPESRQPSPDDQWQAETNRACATAMLDWLKQTVNVKRPICTLTMAELDCIAEAVTSTWIVKTSQRPRQESDAAQANFNLLMGG